LMQRKILLGVVFAVFLSLPAVSFGASVLDPYTYRTDLELRMKYEQMSINQWAFIPEVDVGAQCLHATAQIAAGSARG
jgi:hypothetical protein